MNGIFLIVGIAAIIWFLDEVTRKHCKVCGSKMAMASKNLCLNIYCPSHKIKTKTKKKI